MSQFFTSGGQSFGGEASASVLPVNIQDWFPSGWTGSISLLFCCLVITLRECIISLALTLIWHTGVLWSLFTVAYFNSLVSLSACYSCCFCCSVLQSCLTLHDPMVCSMPGLLVPHHLLDFAPVHVHCISDAIQPSHPQLVTGEEFWPRNQISGLYPTLATYWQK